MTCTNITNSMPSAMLIIIKIKNKCYISKEMVFFVFFLCVLCSRGWARDANNNEVKIAGDGNFLFYNSPAAISYKNGFFVSYLTSDGQILLDLWQRNHLEKSTVVHDHSDQIIKRLGRADDHAAPAIIYDSQESRILLATAYHGTDMYVYEYNIKTGGIKLLSLWIGQYTYPRFIENKSTIALVARKQPDDGTSGDLIIRYLNDDFHKEKIVISSNSGYVIYAGTPVDHEQGIYLTYSVHSYAQNRLQGFHLVKFDLNKNKIIEYCDLTNYLDDNYFSNRPTGIGINGSKLILATSFFDNSDISSPNKIKNYERKQTILILEGEISDCQSYRPILKEEDMVMPYYHTSVSINSNSKYIFFNQNKVITNWKHDNCFRKNAMMYPKFLGRDGVFYANMNSKYSIRNFNNSLYFCSSK